MHYDKYIYVVIASTEEGGVVLSVKNGVHSWSDGPGKRFTFDGAMDMATKLTLERNEQEAQRLKDTDGDVDVTDRWLHRIRTHKIKE